MARGMRQLRVDVTLVRNDLNQFTNIATMSMLTATKSYGLQYWDKFV